MAVFSMSAPLFRIRFSGDPPLYSPYRSEYVAVSAQVVNRSSVAALALLSWDILITTDDEVKLIWPRPWSYTKYVYFIARYIPLLVQISILFIGTELTPHFHFTPHDCYIWEIYQGVASSFIVATVDTVLVLRVHAMYHGHLFVRRLVVLLYVFQIAGMAVGLALSLPGITYDNVCLILDIPRSLIIFGGSSVTFEFFLFVLTLYKFVQAVHSGWGHVPPIVLLMRDGTWAFFLLFVVYIGQICLYFFPHHAIAGMLFGWTLTVFSFCGYRILHNLNRLAVHAVEGSESYGPNSRPVHSEIRFSTKAFEPRRRETTGGQGQEDSYR